MTPNCDDMWELLNLELDDQLTEEEAAQLNTHRSICSQCSTLTHELRTMNNAFSEIGEEDVPVGFSDSVMDKILEQKKTKKVIPLRRPMMQYGSLVAAVGLCFGLYQLDMSKQPEVNGTSNISNIADTSATASTVLRSGVGVTEDQPNDAEVPENYAGTTYQQVSGALVSIDDIGLNEEDMTHIQAVLDEQNTDILDMRQFNHSNVASISLDSWSIAPSGLNYTMVASDIWDGIVKSSSENQKINEKTTHIILLVEVK